MAEKERQITVSIFDLEELNGHMGKLGWNIGQCLCALAEPYLGQKREMTGELLAKLDDYLEIDADHLRRENHALPKFRKAFGELMALYGPIAKAYQDAHAQGIGSDPNVPLLLEIPARWLDDLEEATNVAYHAASLMPLSRDEHFRPGIALQKGNAPGGALGSGSDLATREKMVPVLPPYPPLRTEAQKKQKAERDAQTDEDRLQHHERLEGDISIFLETMRITRPISFKELDAGLSALLHLTTDAINKFIPEGAAPSPEQHALMREIRADLAPAIDSLRRDSAILSRTLQQMLGEALDDFDRVHLPALAAYVLRQPHTQDRQVAEGMVLALAGFSRACNAPLAEMTQSLSTSAPGRGT